ncbi:hypothetical protein C7122_07180 [Lachnospiraceae bacterium oral taxon 096]|nr:hypothetical protein C7122_07180 [Lachnospiraceae bacterium oral taxon 096]
MVPVGCSSCRTALQHLPE